MILIEGIEYAIYFFVNFYSVSVDSYQVLIVLLLFLYFVKFYTVSVDSYQVLVMLFSLVLRIIRWEIELF